MAVLSTNPLEPVFIFSNVNSDLKTYNPVAGTFYSALIDTFIPDVIINNYPPTYTGINVNGILAQIPLFGQGPPSESASGAPTQSIFIGIKALRI